MSRAVCVEATQTEVRAMLGKHGLGYSTVEPLHPSGTRVVLLNPVDAATIAGAYGKKVITGEVTRVPLRVRQLR